MHHHPVSVSLKLWGDILSECFSENPSYLGTSFKASLLKKSLLANLTFPHSLGFSFELLDQFLCVWDFEENIFWNILSVHIFFKKIIFRPFMRDWERKFHPPMSPVMWSCQVPYHMTQFMISFFFFLILSFLQILSTSSSALLKTCRPASSFWFTFLCPKTLASHFNIYFHKTLEPSIIVSQISLDPLFWLNCFFSGQK